MLLYGGATGVLTHDSTFDLLVKLAIKLAKTMLHDKREHVSHHTTMKP
jgi:hypothetical protein